MNFYHLTHLASVMSRIPLVQPFALPASDADNAPMSVPFSSIFDMPRFTSQTNVYAIDWNDIRPSNAGNHDKLGCWIGSVNDVEQIRQRSLTMKDNGVDASFFPLRASAVHADVASGDQVLGESVLVLFLHALFLSVSITFLQLHTTSWPVSRKILRPRPVSSSKQSTCPQ